MSETLLQRVNELISAMIGVPPESVSEALAQTEYARKLIQVCQEQPLATIRAKDEEIARLRAVVDGRVNHVYNGLCPDLVQGHDTRDPECTACAALGDHES